MKNYFGFQLTAEKFLPLWLTLYVVFIVPYVLFIFKMQHFQPGGYAPPMYFFPLMLLWLTGIFFIQFYLVKLFIEGVSYNNKTFVFSGSTMSFVGIILLGIVLTVITLGIYSAWFVRDITRFFVNNTSYDSEKLTFNGKGGRLFLIILLSLIIPLFVFVFIMIKILVPLIGMDFLYRFTFQLVQFIIMVPYMYFTYKWIVDVQFKNYVIKWDTEAFPAMAKLALELILMMITFFIYMPLGSVRLFKYFADRTVAENENGKRQFGFEGNEVQDFFFIWIELLKVIFSLGIYYPWAFCKINKRILERTYVEVI